MRREQWDLLVELMSQAACAMDDAGWRRAACRVWEALGDVKALRAEELAGTPLVAEGHDG